MNKHFALVLSLLFIFASPAFSQVKNKKTKRNVKKENKVVKEDSNMKQIKTTKNTTPGVYSNEPQGIPPSVVQVETALPAFIGYTEKGSKKPTRIRSMRDYIKFFGGPSLDEIGEFKIDENGIVTSPTILTTPKYRMHYMLEMFFANGGKDCFIVSAGHYNNDQYSVKNKEMLAGLRLLNSEDLPTLILFPDAASSKNNGDPADLYKAALAQCAERRDRFLICDVEESGNSISTAAEKFRTSMGTNNLAFGAAYFPSLQTNLQYTYAEDNIQVTLKDKSEPLVLRHTEKSVKKDRSNAENSLYHAENGKYRSQYQEIITIINNKKLVLPPSAAVSGVYALVDGSKGVWKAPANVSLNMVQAPTLNISNNEQEGLNVHSSGKSINAIRSFSGKGILVWGSRTLAGNNIDWKYIPTRRLINMIEKSVRNATEHFAHEPNDANTWVTVKAMIDNYLFTLWRAGGMAGSKPEQAFYVKVGLGSTMTYQDVVEGKMIVEIGISPTRPTEFILLKISQEMKNK